MTSPSPLLYDTYYHIYNRGVNGENIFIEERNYDLFLRLYEKHLTPVVDIFAYCMLRNHFHVSLKTKTEEEIALSKKTLRVSSVSTIKTLKVSTLDSKFGLQDSRANNEDDLQRKPLGFDYISKQFSNFFNAYAKTINKGMEEQAVYFNIPSGGCQLPLTASFGM